MSQPYKKKTQTSYWCLQGSDWPRRLCVCHFVLVFYILPCFLSNSLKFTGSFQPQNLQTSSFPPWDHLLSPSSRHLSLSLQVPLRLHLLGKSILWDSEKHPFPCCMLSWHPGLLFNMHACVLSHVRLFVTPWTVAWQAPLSIGFSRQAYWSGLPFPPPGDLPDPGIKPTSLIYPSWAGIFLTTASPRKPLLNNASSATYMLNICHSCEIWGQGACLFYWLLYAQCQA